MKTEDELSTDRDERCDPQIVNTCGRKDVAEVITDEDIAKVRRWARQLFYLKDSFPDERARMCLDAANLMFAVTERNKRRI